MVYEEIEKQERCQTFLERNTNKNDNKGDNLALMTIIRNKQCLLGKKQHC